MGPGELVVLGTVAIAGTVALPIMLDFRSKRRKRELEHIERMRAIEVGRSFPGELKDNIFTVPQWAVPHLIALAIGALVPLGVFVCAFLATLIGGFHKDIWVASGMVGLGAVISGTVLAGGALKKMNSGLESDHSASYAESKLPIDEDAYDVVSSRG